MCKTKKTLPSFYQMKAELEKRPWLQRDADDRLPHGSGGRRARIWAVPPHRSGPPGPGQPRPHAGSAAPSHAVSEMSLCTAERMRRLTESGCAGGEGRVTHAHLPGD